MDTLLLALVIVSSVLALGGFSLSTDYFRSTTKLNWSQANDYCIDNNGSLIRLNSVNDLAEFISAVRQWSSQSWYWTALRLDSYGCYDKTWIYNGWAYWARGGSEPNGCPSHPCVVANTFEMRTRSCDDENAALCRKDVLIRTQSTHSSLVPANISTTTSIPATVVKTQTAGVTSYVTTTTQSTLSAVLTTGVPNMSTDVMPTPYNNTPVDDGSCEDCCLKPNKSRQLSHEELTSIIQDLKSQLAVNKKHLSANRRKLISVYDSRPSSVAIGGVTVAILVAFVSILVVPDMIKLVRFMNKRKKKRLS